MRRGYVGRPTCIEARHNSAEIVLLDRIEVPAQDDQPPLRTLLAEALANRADVALANITEETQTISAEGTRNAILPYLQGIASTSHNGSSGVPVPGQPSDPYYVGGLGTALACDSKPGAAGRKRSQVD